MEPCQKLTHPDLPPRHQGAPYPSRCPIGVGRHQPLYSVSSSHFASIPPAALRQKPASRVVSVAAMQAASQFPMALLYRVGDSSPCSFFRATHLHPCQNSHTASYLCGELVRKPTAIPSGAPLLSYFGCIPMPPLLSPSELARHFPGHRLCVLGSTLGRPVQFM